MDMRCNGCDGDGSYLTLEYRTVLVSNSRDSEAVFIPLIHFLREPTIDSSLRPIAPPYP
jgi:hypothetical protein